MPHTPKVSERLLFKPIETFTSNKMLTKLIGFCENYSTQYNLNYMLEKLENTQSTKVTMLGLSLLVSQKCLA